MGFFLGKIWAYVSGILLVVVLSMGVMVYNYKNEIKDLTINSLVDQINIGSLEDAIKKYNLIVEEEKIDTEKRNKEFLSSQKPKVVVKYINRYIPKRDGNVSECENISGILTNVRSIGI